MKSYLSELKICAGEEPKIQLNKIFIQADCPELLKMNFEINVLGNKSFTYKLAEHLADEAVNYCQDFSDYYETKNKELKGSKE